MTAGRLNLRPVMSRLTYKLEPDYTRHCNFGRSDAAYSTSKYAMHIIQTMVTLAQTLGRSPSNKCNHSVRRSFKSSPIFSITSSVLRCQRRKQCPVVQDFSFAPAWQGATLSCGSPGGRELCLVGQSTRFGAKNIFFTVILSTPGAEQTWQLMPWRTKARTPLWFHIQQ